MSSHTSHSNPGAHHASKAKKAQAEPHKRIERIIEDSELPTVQCDYFVLKDTAVSEGLTVFQHVCEIRWSTAHPQLLVRKGATDTSH